MKLLFDQNISPSLVALLADLFPESLHVRTVGLERATDDSVWRFALERGFLIVTKDSDFQERGQIAGSAAKVIWIRRGNCSTEQVAAMLMKHASDVATLEQDPHATFLILI